MGTNEKSVYELRAKYNQLLVREKNAEKYLNDNSIPLEEREKWMPKYKDICERLNELLKQIKFYTADNILSGFTPEECTKPISLSGEQLKIGG